MIQIACVPRTCLGATHGSKRPTNKRTANNTPLSLTLPPLSLSLYLYLRTRRRHSTAPAHP